ncbi:DedA family protein [Paenibacillus tuaregi]|uniref:DedA family protein n=1 Tax=Paenibacillus tuaregi TaxID=1816681 RepID=UPI00083822BD|nr:DedA family protein [Paenibacillus tuaregi]
MDYNTMLELAHNFGYAALFFALWLGIVGMPIPDELVVMAGGAVTSGGLLLPLPAFLLTYLGVISGLSVGYLLGRCIGVPILNKLRRNSRMDRYIRFSENMMTRYGSYALCASYFIPVVRHLMPYFAGINKMSFGRYARFSFTAGFVWTLLLFTIGSYVGEHMQDIEETLYNYGII